MLNGIANRIHVLDQLSGLNKILLRSKLKCPSAFLRVR